MPPQTAPPTARTIRLIHGALVAGVILFAFVSYFLLWPATASSGGLPPAIVPPVLGLVLVAFALSLVLLRRVPRRRTDESTDLFWRTAATPALITWAVIEGPCLLCLVIYARTGAQPALGVAALGIVLFILLNPGRLERRTG